MVSYRCHIDLVIFFTDKKILVIIIMIKIINMVMITAGKYGLPDGGPGCPATTKVYTVIIVIIVYKLSIIVYKLSLLSSTSFA